MKAPKKLIVAVALGLALLVAVGGVSLAAGPGATSAGRGPNGVATACNCTGQASGVPDAVVSLLGMTRADIAAERQSGKSLAQIAAEKGVSQDQLVETMLAARKVTLDEQVKSGAITQAQADYMYSQMQQRVTDAVNRTTTGPNRQDGAPGMGLGMGWGRGNGQGRMMGRQ